MNTHPLDSQKAYARKLALQQRLLAKRQSPEASALLVERLIEYLQDIPKAVVAGYLPISSEIDPEPCMHMFRRIGAQTALPVVVAEKTALLFRTFTPGDPLIVEKFKTQAPAATAREIIPSLVLVPMLAFSIKGYRLGYGGGFYDRTIAEYQLHSPDTRFIGLAYDAQRNDDIPLGQYDHSLEAIVTERAVYKA